MPHNAGRNIVATRQPHTFILSSVGHTNGKPKILTLRNMSLNFLAAHQAILVGTGHE